MGSVAARVANSYVIYMDEMQEADKIQKILSCYICKKPIETEKANFDLLNRVAVHLKERKSFLKKLFSENNSNECTMKYIKTISATGREIDIKEIKIDDIFRHHRELFIIINEQELPPEKKDDLLPKVVQKI